MDVDKLSARLESTLKKRMTPLNDSLAMRTSMSDTSLLSHHGSYASLAESTALPLRGCPSRDFFRALPTLNSVEARREELQREYASLDNQLVVQRRQTIMGEWNAIRSHEEKVAGIHGQNDGSRWVLRTDEEGIIDPAIDEPTARAERVRARVTEKKRVSSKITEHTPKQLHGMSLLQAMRSSHRGRAEPHAILSPSAEPRPTWLEKGGQALRFFMYVSGDELPSLQIIAQCARERVCKRETCNVGRGGGGR